MAVADFNTYTEVNPSAEIVVDRAKINFTDLALDEEAHISKDYGAGFFTGDFIHRQKVVHTASDFVGGGNGGQCLVWGLSAGAGVNTVIDFFAGVDGIFIYMGNTSGTTYWIQCRDQEGAQDNDTFITNDAPESFWMEIERAGTTLTIKVYTDAYITLADTLSITCGTTAYRYHTAVGGYGKLTAEDDVITGYVEHFDPSPSTSAQPPYEDFFTDYSEVDEGDDVTKTYTEALWVGLARTATSRVWKDFGVDYFDRDFTHTFEVIMSDGSGVPIEHEHWCLANVVDDFSVLETGDVASLGFYTGDNSEFRLYFHLYEGGVWKQDNTGGILTEDTLYFVTIQRDQDGGANGTGQYITTIRTGSHTGSVVDTLSVDASAGEQRRWRYYYALNTVDSGGSVYSDGFTRNVTLSQAAGGVVKPNFRMTRASQQEINMYGPPSTGMGLTS